jgi:hypothetical protein
MTITQLHLFNAAYLVALIVIAVLTRATARRIVGALAGGLALGLLTPIVIAVGERLDLLQLRIEWQPYFLTLLVLDLALCGWVLLLVWRIVRRFGSRSLVAILIGGAFLGPPRDYWYMAHFPEWGTYGTGIGTVIFVSAFYVVGGVVGYGVMWLVAGPADEDPLARLPWQGAHKA